MHFVYIPLFYGIFCFVLLVGTKIKVMPIFKIEKREGKESV